MSKVKIFQLSTLVTSIHKENNHLLLENIEKTLSKFHCFSSEIFEKIEFLANIGCDTGSIICVL